MGSCSLSDVANKRFDVVVVGGGPVGLATALECAKAHVSVLVVERFSLFNYSGSSGDLVRMFRLMYTEKHLADLALVSKSLWHKLEQEGGEPLILKTGFPTVPWRPPGIARIAVDHAKRIITDPTQRQLGPDPDALASVQGYLHKHMEGVELVPNFSGACLQTNVADGDFVLDYVPGTDKHVLIFCAGWVSKTTLSAPLQ
ncbi:hypothetical protein WJX72_012196 [[Myrmecia] bisecta]|uniref:FAD dependent oxidoreductase domain-containing protein n=1 Tax=[Myrmecia] bisecta TaxID=41462 RepID=A0AAW1PVE4_9CHLO